MRKPTVTTFALAVCLAARAFATGEEVGSRAPAPAMQQPVNNCGIGSTMQQILDCIGSPTRTSQDVTPYGTTTYWYYPKGNITFSNGVVTGLHMKD